MGGVLQAADVREALLRGASTRRRSDREPEFDTGRRVVTINDHPGGHTRLPRYLRGRVGTIDRVHGVFVFADANATGRGPQPQHLYSVRFSASTLWGADGHPRDVVYADLWESHLRACPD